MCRFSIEHSIATMNAKKGQKVVVEKVGHGQKWLVEETPDPGYYRGGAVCVKDGATLRFSDIPVEMQEKYGLDSCERALFREGIEKGCHMETPDQFFFRTGDLLKMEDMPIGLRGEIESLTPLPLDILMATVITENNVSQDKVAEPITPVPARSRARELVSAGVLFIACLLIF